MHDLRACLAHSQAQPEHLQMLPTQSIRVHAQVGVDPLRRDRARGANPASLAPLIWVLWQVWNVC